MDKYNDGGIGGWTCSARQMHIQFTKQSMTPSLVQNDAATRTFLPGINRLRVILSTCRKNASNSSFVIP